MAGEEEGTEKLKGNEHVRLGHRARPPVKPDDASEGGAALQKWLHSTGGRGAP